VASTACRQRWQSRGRRRVKLDLSGHSSKYPIPELTRADPIYCSGRTTGAPSSRVPEAADKADAGRPDGLDIADPSAHTQGYRRAPTRFRAAIRHACPMGAPRASARTALSRVRCPPWPAAAQDRKYWRLLQHR
jgi:hypothetical protein